MGHPDLAVVTGAFGYTGRFVARRLIDEGVRVRILIRRADRRDVFAILFGLSLALSGCLFPTEELPPVSLEFPTSQAVPAISAGKEHTCMLVEDGSPACWGFNNYGQAAPIAGEYVAISAGDFHTCALRADGSPVCWGINEDYLSLSPPENEHFVAISSGGEHACGLRGDGSAVCWGSDSSGQSSPPPGERFISLGSGTAYRLWHPFERLDHVLGSKWRWPGFATER